MGRMVQTEEFMNDICILITNGNSDKDKGEVMKFHAHVSKAVFSKIIKIVCEDQKNNPVQEQVKEFMSNFIDPKDRNKPVTTSSGVEIYPRDIEAGKFTKSRRICPEIGRRYRKKS